MESQFVEVILTVEDQQSRSKEWYGDAYYSETEILETHDLMLMEINEEKKITCTSRIISLFSDLVYSPDREMTDYEIDTLL